jgi:uncharacterized NAD(P)/FAD-binding protein YdhS
VRNLVAEPEAEVEPTRVLIVGGGAAGVITAAHLLRAADDHHPVDVRIVESGDRMGPGLAYRTKHPRHTLNNFAGRLSAIDGEPDHLLRWCADRGHDADPTSFLPRELYGRYLSDVLDSTAVPPGSILRRNRGVVTDVREEATGLAVQLSCGWTVQTDRVVLALGNPPPRRQPGFEAWGDRYLADPWADDLQEAVGSSHEVLLLGTGLTMVDVVAMLHESSPGTRFTAVSRSGLLPQAHKRRSSRLHDIFHPGTHSVDDLLQSVQTRIEELEDVGGDWRDVIDSVRACANELWRGFSREDQDRFVTNMARRWEIARHRMSPDMAAYIGLLQESGKLRVAKVGELDVSRFDRVVNCTGPAPIPTPGWSALVDTLLERGTVRTHRLGLGLDMRASGRVVGADGTTGPHIYAVGAARRGVEWEVAAIPDLRNQAAELAAHLVGNRASGEEPVVPPDETVPA